MSRIYKNDTGISLYRQSRLSSSPCTTNLSTSKPITRIYLIKIIESLDNTLRKTPAVPPLLASIKVNLPLKKILQVADILLFEFV